MKAIWFAIGALASCSSSGPSLDRASIGNFDYGAPSGWSSKSYPTRGREMFEWRPSDADADKQSLTVIRTDRTPFAKNGDRVARLLADAQRSIPGGTFSQPARFTTRAGFEGVRVEGEFVPRDGKSYRRIHAVLVDGTSLVHVMATGQTIDRDNFDAVVDSFTRKGS